MAQSKRRDAAPVVSYGATCCECGEPTFFGGVRCNSCHHDFWLRQQMKVAAVVYKNAPLASLGELLTARIYSSIHPYGDATYVE